MAPALVSLEIAPGALASVRWPARLGKVAHGVVQVLLHDGVGFGHRELQDHVVGALAVQPDVVVGQAHHDRHALARGRKLERVEELKALVVACVPAVPSLTGRGGGPLPG